MFDGFNVSIQSDTINLKAKNKSWVALRSIFFLLQIPWNPWSRSCSYNVVQKNQAKKNFPFQFLTCLTCHKPEIANLNNKFIFFSLQIKNQPRLKVKSRIVKTLHKKVFETEKKISYPQIMYLSWSLLYFQPFYFVREDVSTKVKKIKVKLLYSTCMYHPNKKDLTLYSPNFWATDISVWFHEKKVFNANFVNTNKKIRTSFLHLIATHKHAGRWK